jgi:prepilin-type N-terminal cleavage/methylation domain-containing protein
MSHPRPSQRTHTSPPARRGVTLVELVVVLVCLSLAAAIVLPGFNSLPSIGLRSAAEALVADLEYAQQQSMAHSDDCRAVVFDPATNSYWIAPGSNPVAAGAIPHPVDKLPFVSEFGAGRLSHLGMVRIESCDAGGDNRIVFRSLGQLDQTNAARIVLASGQRRITITLDPTTGEATIGNMN